MKTKMKRILSFMLVVIMLISVVPTMNVSAASATSKGTCGKNLTWKINSKGTLTISGSGKMYDYANDTAYFPPWYKAKKKIKKIVIKDGVENIGDYAFLSCTKVEKVILPDEITSIGKNAFERCENLKEITLPKSLKTISKYMFVYCNNLTDIVIPNGVTKIEDDAFYGCSSLKNLNIPASVAEISYTTFYRTTGIESVNVDSNNPYFSSQDGILFDKDKTEILGYPGAKKDTAYTVPSTVKTIGKNAFAYCDNLKELTVPEGVTRIKRGAFRSTHLKSLSIPQSAKQLDNAAFEHLKVKEITLPSGIKKIPKGLFRYSDINVVNIPDGVTTIESNAFFECYYLKKITIPSSVKKIGKDAFYNCRKLEETHISDLAAWCEIDFPSYGSNPIEYSDAFYLNGQLVTDLVIPEGVTKIGTFAFYKSKFKSLKLPSTLKTIGDNVFDSSWDIEKVEIPNGVTKIGSNAFCSCDSLKELTIPSTVETIGNHAFEDCAVVSVKIPNGVKEIGEKAFSFCTNLKSITIPKSVTKIGYGALEGTSSLEKIKVNSKNPNYKSVKNVLFNKKMTELIRYCAAKTGTSYTLPESVTKIAYGAFEYSKNLETFKGSKNLKSIGEEAFFDCENLKKVTNIDSVKTLGKSAFLRCYDLESIKLSNNITVIPESAFGLCSSLKEITLPNKLTKIETYAFFSCRSLKKIKFPITLTSIGEDAFASCKKLKTYEIPASVTTLDDSFIGWYKGGEYGEYVYKNVKIKGYKGSAAENYAKENNIEFVELKSHTHKYTGKLTVPATTKSDGSNCSVCSICGKAKVNTKIAKIKSVKLSKAKFEYNGEKQKPTVTVKDTNGKTLKKGTDYTVKYPKGCKKVGEYEVAVTFKGKYAGEKKLFFKIVPKKTSITKVTAGVRQFTVAWDKNAEGITGYQIQYSTSKDMKNDVYTVDVNKSKNAETIIRLISGTKYYVRVRTYKTIEIDLYNEPTFCSSWSEVKSVKVK